MPRLVPYVLLVAAMSSSCVYAQEGVWADIAIEKKFKYEAGNQYLGTYKIRVKNLSKVPIPAGHVVEIVDTLPKDLYIHSVKPSIGGPSGTGAWRCRKSAAWANNLALPPSGWSVGSDAGPSALVCRLKNAAPIAPGKSFPPLRLEWEGDNEEQNAVAVRLYATSPSGLSVVPETTLANNKATAIPE